MGRDIQAIKISGEDRRRYRDKGRRSLEKFARMLRERHFDEKPSMVGQEIELNLVDDPGMPSMRNAEALEAIADPAWATEVGQFNLEINVPPRQLGGDAFDGLETEVRADLNAADGKARTVGSHLVMIGILPTLDEYHVGESAMSANERYKVLNEQIFAARGEDMRLAIDGAEQLLTHARCIPRSARTPSRTTGTRPRPSPACRSRSAPTPRSCSASSCGTRPGSRCSSSSRRTCGTSRRCCRSARRRSRSTCWTAAPAPSWPR